MRPSGSFLMVALAVLLFQIPQAASGQTAAIRGFVVTESTRPLASASVVLLDGQEVVSGAGTDGDGVFLLNRLVPGSYVLRVSFLGYETHTEPVTLAAGESRLFRITLLEAPPESLDDVVVVDETETGTANVRAGLQVITAADISTVPVPGVSGDLASYLQSVPGVVAQGDRGGQVFVRGGAIDQNLATLDGFPIYYPFHVLSFYSAFPEDVIDKADFYTAGFGASYGSRVSSVIDVEMRNGNKQRFAGAVSLSPFLSGIHAEGPLIKDRVSMILAVRESLVKTITPNLFGQRFPYQFGDRFGKLHATIGNNHSVSMTGLYTYDRGDLAGTRLSFDGEVIDDAPVDSNEVAWTNALFGGHYIYVGSDLPILLDLSAGWSRLTNDVGPEGLVERSSGIESTDFAADLTWFLKAGTARTGLRVRSSTFDYDVGGLFDGLSTSSLDLTEVIGYAEARLGIGNVEVNPGLQLYAPSGDYSLQLDPRLRADWRSTVLKLPVAVHAAGGIYHQAAVGLTDERDIGNVYTAWLTAPEGRALPEAKHAVLGLRVGIDRYLTVSAEAFVKEFTSLSVPIFSTLPEFTTRVQRADGLAKGIDGRLVLNSYPIDAHWTIDASIGYSLTAVEYKTASVTYTPSHDRRHQAITVVTLRRGEFAILVQNQIGSGLPYTASSGFDRFLFLNPDTDVSSEPGIPRLAYGAPFAERLPNYVRTDVWAERRVESKRSVLTLRAGALNVFNRDNLFYFDLFTFTRVNQLPFIPSVGLKAEFR